MRQQQALRPTPCRLENRHRVHNHDDVLLPAGVRYRPQLPLWDVRVQEQQLARRALCDMLQDPGRRQRLLNDACTFKGPMEFQVHAVCMHWWRTKSFEASLCQC